MKAIFVLIGFALSSALAPPLAFSANMSAPAGIPSLTVGGYTFTNLSNLKVLVGQGSNAAAYWVALRNTDGTAYQVPVGKTLKIKAIKLITLNTTSTDVRFLYGDNAVDSTSAPTTPVYPYSQNYYIAAGVAAVGTYLERTHMISIPTGKYPHFLVSAGASAAVTVYGYEE